MIPEPFWRANGTERIKQGDKRAGHSLITESLTHKNESIMTFSRRRFYTIGFAILAIGTLTGMGIQSVLTNDNLVDQIKKLGDVYGQISRNYVEDIDADKLTEDAIEGMLSGLDPHSVYIDKDRMKQVNENFSAAFEGIGVQYEWTEGLEGADTLTVVIPVPGGPSEEVGIHSGDRIISVNGISTLGWEKADVDSNLKGPKGTKVKVDVVRPGYPKVLEFEITRDRIPIYTVDASYMVDGETGYIKLNRFARTTHAEVLEGIKKLKAEGMQRLIFDLRGNNGGYMDMAVKLSDEFLSGQRTVVSTKSRHAKYNQVYETGRIGEFEEGAIIVLVDENSASASEIVAGALQDHDRALVMGRRTFGKGLVQRQFQLRDGSVLQMTTSKYYTPSGRLIQIPYERGEKDAYYGQHRDRFEFNAQEDIDKFLESAPDSLKFRTSQGRIVFGGGGIVPDMVVQRDTNMVMRAVIGGGADRLFVRKWMDGHPEFREKWIDRQDEFNADFQISAAIMAEFWEYATGDDFGVKVVPDAEMPDSNVDEEHFYLSQSDINKEVKTVETRIKAYMARRMWGVAAWYPVIHSIDTTFIQALDSWDKALAMAEND